MKTGTAKNSNEEDVLSDQTALIITTSLQNTLNYLARFNCNIFFTLERNYKPPPEKAYIFLCLINLYIFFSEYLQLISLCCQYDKLRIFMENLKL